MGSFRELVPRVSPDGRWQDNGPHPSHTTGYSLNYETRGLAVLLILAVGLALGLLYWSARAQDEILIQSSGELAGTGLEIHARTLRNILTDYTY